MNTLRMKNAAIRKLSIFLLACLLLSACAQAPSQPIEVTENIASPTPTQTVNSAMEYTSLVEPNQTYTCEMLVEDANELAAAYPELIEVTSAGQSVEGRALTLIKLGRGDIKVLLLGAHHAREYITSAFLMETVDEYARAYMQQVAQSGTNLLDSVTLYILPMVNPDGVNLVQNGPDAAKDPERVKSMRMLKETYAEWKANINGVDLNRQYPCHWEEKTSDTDVPSSEMYKGTAPATEPEV